MANKTPQALAMEALVAAVRENSPVLITTAAQAKQLVNHVLACVLSTTEEHGRLAFNNIGIFKRKDVAARDYRNPMTNQTVHREATTRVTFKPSKTTDK